MMKKAMSPFNLELLIPTEEQCKILGRVTSNEIFEGVGGSFHPDGLFSTDIFGRVGSQERDSSFGYIRLGLEILHPIVYRNLIRLRAFYEDIILGKAFAVFDEKQNDFVLSNELEGATGYSYFFNNWKRIKFSKTKSSIRGNRLALIEKYKGNCSFSNLLVIPAAYREAEIDFDGRVNMDEVNDLYKTMLTASGRSPDRVLDESELVLYDRNRVTMQLTSLAIYAHYEKLLFGKKGFIQGKWAARRIFNGTRNVISSLDTSANDLDAENRPKFKDVVTGIHQTAAGTKDKAIYHIRTLFLDKVFDTLSNTVQLINPKTLKLEWVELTNEEMDTWSTIEGNARVIDELSISDKRTRPVVIGDYYLALIYLGKDNTFKVFRDINDVPPHIDIKLVRPLTYAEMVYIALIQYQKNLVGFLTRYPIENYNSSFPVNFYIKTTIKGELRHQLNNEWEKDDSLAVAYEYPIFELNKPANWHDSVSMSAAMLAPLGADQQ